MCIIWRNLPVLESLGIRIREQKNVCSEKDETSIRVLRGGEALNERKNTKELVQVASHVPFSNSPFSTCK